MYILVQIVITVEHNQILQRKLHSVWPESTPVSSIYLAKKIDYISRDIEIFLGVYFFGAPSIYRYVCIISYWFIDCSSMVYHCHTQVTRWLSICAGTTERCIRVWMTGCTVDLTAAVKSPASFSVQIFGLLSGSHQSTTAPSFAAQVLPIRFVASQLLNIIGKQNSAVIPTKTGITGLILPVNKELCGHPLYENSGSTAERNIYDLHVCRLRQT